MHHDTMADPRRDNARLLVEFLPQAMQAMRSGMRSGRRDGMSVPQFRTLAFLDYMPGASVGDAAGHVGLGAPAMSVIVDGLVKRGLVLRGEDDADRRRTVLSLTAAGRAILGRARISARRCMAERLAGLDAAGHQTVADALRLLQPLFPAPPKEST